MPQSPTASKREIALAFSASKHTVQTVTEIAKILKVVAQDSEVSKGILTRPFWGRLKWLVLGR